ncbi:30S ribosome-binding factor RbfA [Isoalcanivorax indicus]|uniref:30S ribosome-binding factor RbfA n=1 Tax=Isoalcanivorax indicus TaxID=2202653 RepID=UPI000DB90FEF|nr:30S ribosome-binding factor RbfA [Isoalcanivorax indicus]
MSRHRRPQGFQRTDRIGDYIQRELAEVIRREVKDPRLGLVTVQQVRVARDLSWADVYFTLLGQDAEDGAQAEAVLGNAAGFLRSQLAKDLNTRTTPRLRFHYDKLPEQASRLSSLIDQARAEDRDLIQDPADDQNDNDSDADPQR